MGNPLSWPEIKHLPDHIRSLLDAHIRYRDDPDKIDITLRKPLSKEKLYEILFSTPWFANVKYDGTNVAISSDGKLYGRRQQIINPSYQKLDTTFLKQIDINPLKDGILGDFKDKISKFFVYGELMINNKFDYSEKEYFRKWLAFGICIEIPQVNDGINLHQYLLNNGFRCNSIPRVKDNNRTKLTILLNDKLCEYFTNYNIPFGETIYNANSLYDLIITCKDWMINGNGEGLVCVADEHQKKWKIGLEVQPSVFSVLQDCYNTLLKYDDIDKRIFEMCDVLFKVKESKLHMGKFVNTTKKKQEKKLQVLLVDENQMKGAIESALTKYDSLEVFFKDNKMKELVNIIIQEVSNDILPTINDDINKSDVSKEINNTVRKYIGVRFGMWKAGKSI